jgi:hypothetical protein
LTTPLKRFIKHGCDALLTIGINPKGKRPAQQDTHGSKEETKAKIIAGDGSPNLGAFNCSV